MTKVKKQIRYGMAFCQYLFQLLELRKEWQSLPITYIGIGMMARSANPNANKNTSPRGRLDFIDLPNLLFTYHIGTTLSTKQIIEQANAYARETTKN